MPKILGASPKGRSDSINESRIVVVPPAIIELKAASVFGLRKVSKASTGTSNPDTMIAYEYNINCSTPFILSAIPIATIPIASVNSLENKSTFLSVNFPGMIFSMMSVNILPEAAIRQLSAVDKIAEK